MKHLRNAVLTPSLFALASLPAIVLLLPVEALAQGASLGQLQRLGDVNVQTIVSNVIRAFLGVTGSIALLMFVYGGFTWMTAAGNDDKIKKAKNTIVWSVLGLIIMFFAFTAVNFVLNTISGTPTSTSTEQQLPPCPTDGSISEKPCFAGEL